MMWETALPRMTAAQPKTGIAVERRSAKRPWKKRSAAEALAASKSAAAGGDEDWKKF
jgi:hypothetical protein